MNIPRLLSLAIVALATSCYSPYNGYSNLSLPSAVNEAWQATMLIHPVPDNPYQLYENPGFIATEYQDYWQTPKETLERHTGDCEDLAFMLQDELAQRNFTVQVVFGQDVASTAVGRHAWCEYVDVAGNRIVLDPFFSVWRMNPDPNHWIAFAELPPAVTVRLLDYQSRIAAGQ